MKYNIHLWILATVGTPISVVIVDGPNVYHDNVCKKHRVRNCSPCQDEMIKLGGDCVVKKRGKVFANQKNDDWWERTLDMDRLPRVANFIQSHGHKPVIYCQSSTRGWLSGYGLKKYPDDVGPKHKILEELHQQGVVVFDTHGGKPRGVHKDEDDNWDDDIWIIHMALQYREQHGVDSYIMSNDKFRNWKKKRQDLDWKLIQNIHIMFEWQPKEAKEEVDQLFLAAKLKKLKSLPADASDPIEDERERIKGEIERHERIAESLQDELDKFAVTSSSEIKEKKESPHVEEIIRAWEKSLNKNQTSIWNYWFNLRLELAWPVTYDYPITHEPGVDFTHPASAEDRLVRVKLGFEDDVNPYRVVEECLIIYSNTTGKELKFSPDQTVITRIDSEDEEE